MPISEKQNRLSLLEGLYAQPDGPVLSSFATRQASRRAFWNDDARVVRMLSYGVVSLCLIGLGVGALRLRSHVYGPLESRLAAAQNVDQFSFDLNAPADLLGLAKLDTDHDGLSDYDEQEVYRTSRYLEDSDSDGTTDKDEIAKGTDPNCAFERDCPASYLSTSLEAGQPPATSNPLDVLNGKASPDQIRDLLVQSGVSRQEVDQLTDAQLNQAYQEVLAEARQGLSEKVGASVPAAAPSLEQLSGSPEQLRQLLINYGISASDLSQISDAQLLDLARQTLAEQSQASAPASGSSTNGTTDGSLNGGQITGEQSLLP